MPHMADPFAQLLVEVREELESEGDDTPELRAVTTSWPMLPREQTQVSVRVGNSLLDRIDKAATRSNQKRAFYVRELLEKHVPH